MSHELTGLVAMLAMTFVVLALLACAGRQR